MARFGFCGPSYPSQSPNADAQRCINWYPEAIESGMGKSAYALYPTPGLSLFATLGAGPVVDLFSKDGRCFALSAGGFYELYPNGTATLRGNVVQGSPAKIYAGLTQLFIISGGHAYVFNLQSFLFVEVTASLAQNTPKLGGWTDGYFFVLFGGANSNEFQISNLGDATTWNGVNVAQVSVFPDGVNSMLVDHREVWFFGNKSTQVYYDSGAANFPFSPIPGAFIEQGSIAVLAPVRMDNSVFWLGGDERGQAIAWRAQGYVPTRVSNHAVEFQWSTYSTVTDAVGWTYQDQGHTFWVLYFPTANTTWVYDAATQMWHERAFYTAGVYSAALPRCHCAAFGLHLVGDRQSGKVYTMSISTGNDNGTSIRRLRRAPHVSNEQEWIFHKQMQVDLEVATTTFVNPTQGWNPQLMLRWSDDATKTWSNEYDVSAGQEGQTKIRAIWRRLGRSRDRIYELTVTDSIPWRIPDAYLDADPGYAPSERLVKQLGKVQ